MFSILSVTKITILAYFILTSAKSFNLDQSRSLSFGKELTVPNDKIQDLFKLKAFADKKRDVAEKLNFVLERVENIVGK